VTQSVLVSNYPRFFLWHIGCSFGMLLTRFVLKRVDGLCSFLEAADDVDQTALLFFVSYLRFSGLVFFAFLLRPQ
jgi:hypothetical protein